MKIAKKKVHIPLQTSENGANEALQYAVQKKKKLGTTAPKASK